MQVSKSTVSSTALFYAKGFIYANMFELDS